MKKTFIIIFVSLFLVACGNPQPTSKSDSTISEIEYKQALGKAVCEAVDTLNAEGILNDEKRFASEFDKEIQKAIHAMGYTETNWLSAKAKYFPNEEEHNKLIKLHFTWCLMKDSISSEE